MEEIEVLLYSCASQLLTVNAARKQLFSYKNRKLEIKYFSFESSSISACETCIIPSRLYLGIGSDSYNPSLPSPGDWSWKTNADEKWSPLWTTLPEASKQCRELIKCNCKKGHCKCRKANLKCTMLYYCTLNLNIKCVVFSL